MAKKNKLKKKPKFSTAQFETPEGYRIIAEAPQAKLEDFVKDCYPDIEFKKVGTC